MNKESQPIHVALPNTTELKMKAILAIAQAVENVSKAIISTNVKVDINNCHVVGAETGIRIDYPESA